MHNRTVFHNCTIYTHPNCARMYFEVKTDRNLCSKRFREFKLLFITALLFSTQTWKVQVPKRNYLQDQTRCRLSQLPRSKFHWDKCLGVYEQDRSFSRSTKICTCKEKCELTVSAMKETRERGVKPIEPVKAFTDKESHRMLKYNQFRGITNTSK